MVLGRRRLSIVGNRVFVLWSIDLCEGDPALLSTGVFLRSSRARYMSWPSSVAFLIRFLIVCTTFSALPFDCG